MALEIQSGLVFNSIFWLTLSQGYPVSELRGSDWRPTDPVACRDRDRCTRRLSASDLSGYARVSLCLSEIKHAHIDAHI